MEPDIDLAIKIPADLILKEFECPVCFCTIQEACITKCGHTFCKACIEECLNRRHECPNCKHETKIEEIIRNFGTDAIIKILIQEKEKATKEYYDQVCGALNKHDSVSLNPIEAVFHQNMKANFLEFERYFEDLKQRNERMKNKLKNNENDPVVVAKKCEELDQSLARSIEMITMAYDKHMKSVAPSPDLLPVRIFLKVPKKGLTLDLHVPRTHTSTDFQQLIIDHYHSKNDYVEQITEGNFLLHQAVRENSEIIVIGNEPIGKHEIVQGSTIFFDGDVILKSDAPKECFTRRFKKGEGLKTNYYHCFNCNTNWICEPCSQTCHVGHNISIAIPNHEPTWACCYCVKKGMCCIPNNKT